MEKRITEASVLFVSVFKWVILAIGTGALVGVSTALFLKALTWSMDYAGNFPRFFLFLLPSLSQKSLIPSKGALREGKIMATFTMNPTIDTSVAAVMTPGTELCRREDAERLYREMGSRKSSQPRGEEK